MGRSGVNQTRSQTTSQKGLTSYLMSGKSSESLLQSGPSAISTSKVATIKGTNNQGSDSISKADLLNLKADISEDLLKHLQPICEQLEEIRSTHLIFFQSVLP